MDTRKFIGYIWPIRQDEYNKSPSKYAISLTEQMNIKEPLYKGFGEYWASTYSLKEFDKTAPQPGVNWHGRYFLCAAAVRQFGNSGYQLLCHIL